MLVSHALIDHMNRCNERLIFIIALSWGRPSKFAEEICKMLQIFINTLPGRIIELNMDNNDTIDKMKHRVEEKEGIPPDQQRLIFQGKILEDVQKLSDYAQIKALSI